jgi:hypothetical protein
MLQVLTCTKQEGKKYQTYKGNNTTPTCTSTNNIRRTKTTRKKQNKQNKQTKLERKKLMLFL